MKTELTHFQIKALLELAEGSGDPENFDDLNIRIVVEDTAHSGPGLYAEFQEVPEEGWHFIGTDHEDQARGDSICDAKIATGEVKEI
jgi:hypothetical protein